MRIKFIKDFHQYRKGQISHMTSNIAQGFVSKGVAVVSKDMTTQDYSTKIDKKTLKKLNKGDFTIKV